MDTNKLQIYIEENFTLDGTSKHLISSILEYAKKINDINVLDELLDCIGIEKDEIINNI
ncbi:hypothetical protein [Fusobacterium sp.]|uniref:hypothetical protein n=1 Tax=Fusobacterium sp. TaxID=68766 RepID=UPI002623A7F8|nr:hypothetical protein [Fusobacterium sp.]